METMTATTTDKRIDDPPSEMQHRLEQAEVDIRELRAGQKGLRAEIKAGDDAMRLEMRGGFAAVNASIEGIHKLLFQFLILVSTIVAGVVTAAVIALLKLHS